MDEAELFLVGLTLMPLVDWYAAVSATKLHDHHEAVRALDAAIHTPDVLFPAWLVRDRVATACHRFGSPEGRRLCPPARVHRVKAATEWAAQALLVRSSLTSQAFDLLYGGFARALPAAHRRAAS